MTPDELRAMAAFNDDLAWRFRFAGTHLGEFQGDPGERAAVRHPRHHGAEIRGAALHGALVGRRLPDDDPDRGDPGPA